MVLLTVGAGSDPLERFAAAELGRYLEALFATEVTHAAGEAAPAAGASSAAGAPTTVPAAAQFYVGCPGSLAGCGPAAAVLRDVAFADQTIAIRSVPGAQVPSLVLSGGSPRAVLWAVYEYLRQCGVAYLVTEDVLPDPRPLELPAVELVRSPCDSHRVWAFPFGLMFGPEAWGLAEYRRIIDQLAKLAFTRVSMQFYPEFPHLPLRLGGVERSTADLFLGLHVPLGPDMVGRELFDHRRLFWNPDLPLDAPIGETLAAGQRLVRGVIEHAHARGMEFLIGCLPLEYTPEFAPLLGDPLPVTTLGARTVVPGRGVDLDDPALLELALGMFRATVDTYPEADAVGIVMPEFREWIEQAPRAWAALNARYGIGDSEVLQKVLAAAAQRTSYPGGAERAGREVQGDIVALYFYDRFFNDFGARAQTCKPGMRIVYQYLAEELYEYLPRILPPDIETVQYVDYTPLRVLYRRERLHQLDGSRTPSVLCFTLHDDNVGFFPMLATGSLDALQREIRAAGWRGFISRYWLTSDHDACVAHLARAAWDPDMTPSRSYAQFVTAVCGDRCVSPLGGVFAEVERATALLEWDGLGLGFPTQDLLLRHWATEQPADQFRAVRECYARALRWAAEARAAVAARGAAYVQYWVDRLAFAVDWFDAIEHTRRAGAADRAGDAAAALRHAQTALVLAESAARAFARAARNQSDRASVAVINEFGIRALRGQIATLRRRATGRLDCQTVFAGPGMWYPSVLWRRHAVRRRSTAGDEAELDAQLQIVSEQWQIRAQVPYLVYMPERDRLVLLVQCEHQPAIVTSADQGAHWSRPRFVSPDLLATADRFFFGVGLTYLGGGRAIFTSARGSCEGTDIWYSEDYGDTWQVRARLPLAFDGKPCLQWDPFLVDYNPRTREAERILLAGFTTTTDANHCRGFLRVSRDAGLTWGPDEVVPQWDRANEIALTRAANGDLLAAARRDPAPEYADAIDHYTGFGVSRSADDGRTWSPLVPVFDVGRHHTSTVVLPSGELVMSYVVRAGCPPTADGYPQFGVEAIVSRDHGKSWDVDRPYVLHRWCADRKDDRAWWRSVQQTSSVLLPDGTICTAFGTWYRSEPAEAGLIRPLDVGIVRWRPA